MRLGVSFPHQAIGSDSIAIRDWAQAVEDLGFDHLIVYEHVLGPDPSIHLNAGFEYTNRNVYHEALVLCGFLAATTRRIGLQTAVTVLPLRDTIIFAKQAAEVDLLSHGRLRVGVGAGWMAFEFAALDRDFHTRGARLGEQMALLRALWSNPSVTMHGRWHHIEGAGINPMPVQRPIPVWVGGTVRAAVRRVAQHGDGWIAGGEYASRPPDNDARQMLAWLHEEARAAGHRPDEFGVQGGMSIGPLPETEWATRAEAWARFGATDLIIDTTLSLPTGSLDTVGQQIRALGRVKAALG